MSNAQRKGKRKSSALYAQRGNREKNKARRIAKDARRAFPLSCGHGSRYLRNHDYCGKCGQRSELIPPRFQA